MSIAAIIVIVLLCLVIILFIIFLLRKRITKCCCPKKATTTKIINDSLNESKVVTLIPAAALASTQINKSSGYCTICLDDLNNGTVIASVNSCSHVFHQQCLESWIKSNDRCPLCRGDLK